MKFFGIMRDKSPRYTGNLNATHKWVLPGIEPCPECGLVGGDATLAQYPCVDLSVLPPHELKKLSDAWPVPREEFLRRRELVRPLAPPGALLLPGAAFGPLTGTGMGHFGQIVLQNPWSLCMRREALERLRAEGVRGLQSCPVQVRFRTKQAPELLDVQLDAQGHLHPACLPAPGPTCPRCGFAEEHPRPEVYWLDAASLPEHLDVFRLVDSSIVVNERFVEAVAHLKLDGVVFHELQVR